MSAGVAKEGGPHRPAGAVIVVTRFIVPDDAGGVARAEFLALTSRLQSAMSARPGHLRTALASAVDDPSRWVLVSEWDGVGAWRRALSAYDVRIEAVPLMALAETEPAVYQSHE